MDAHCKAICDCHVQSVNVCIPSNSHHKHVAGLNECACLLKQQAPSGISFRWIVGVTTTIRKKTKQQYKAEVR